MLRSHWQKCIFFIYRTEHPVRKDPIVAGLKIYTKSSPRYLINKVFLVSLSAG